MLIAQKKCIGGDCPPPRITILVFIKLNFVSLAISYRDIEVSTLLYEYVPIRLYLCSCNNFIILFRPGCA